MLEELLELEERTKAILTNDSVQFADVHMRVQKEFTRLKDEYPDYQNILYDIIRTCQELLRRLAGEEAPEDAIRRAAHNAPQTVEVQRPAQPQTQSRTYTEPYVLRDIRCVGSDGAVFEEYAELRIQANVARQGPAENSPHQRFNLYQAIAHFENRQGLFLPSMALSCNILVALFREAVRKEQDGTYTTLNQHAKQILDQYKNYGPDYGWHAQNTVVNWGGKEIVHYPKDDDFPEKYGGTTEINMQRRKIIKEFDRKGFKDCTLEQACQKPNMLAYLQDFTGVHNPAELGEIAGYFRKTVVSVGVSPKNKTRTVWLGCHDRLVYFDFHASRNLDVGAAARGVESIQNCVL